MIIFLILVIMLIICQNFLAVGLSKALQISPLVGLCTGSIPMIGGHGTAGAFGPVLEDFGVKGASTLCTAAATFGLIAGSIMGGPVGKRLIEKKDLLKTAIPEDDSLLIEEEKKHERHTSMYPAAVFQLIIAMGIGTIISKLLSMTGMTFPIYIGAMIAAAFWWYQPIFILRNRHDHFKIMAACRPCTSTDHITFRTNYFDVLIYLFCSI